MIVLAGDIGGTNIRLALFSGEVGITAAFREAVYPSCDFNSMSEVLLKFLSKNGEHIEAAAFVLAGPVVDDQVVITNLGWIVSEDELRVVLGDIPIEFYNDLAGLSNFIAQVQPSDLIVLNQGESEENGAIAVIAPGTGLGEGFLVWSEAGYQVQPSEGGHASFAPENKIQEELLKFMRTRYQHVSFERVCSGSAIPDLYEFIKSQEKWEEPEWLIQELREADDKTPVIIQAAIDSNRKSELCLQVVELFVQILAAEAGNMALKVLALGGVYLAGGLPKNIIPVLHNTFVEYFATKGRFSKMLASIPVYVVVHPQPALFGAACYAFKISGKMHK